jgi:hypothetical protein
MKMTQAWVWLTAGVLAAGLNASYHNGGLQWAHQIAGRVQLNSSAVLALASGNANQFLAEARSLKTRNEKTSCQLAQAFDRVQTRIEISEPQFEDFEAMSDRQQAQLDRLEANRERIEAQVAAQTARLRLSSANFAPLVIRGIPSPVVCPRVRVNIPRMPRMKMPVAPQIHIEIPSAGPV